MRVLVASSGAATPSNCRNILLRCQYRLAEETQPGTLVKIEGMVKTWQLETIGSQALREALAFYGCSSQTKCGWVECIIIQLKI